MIRGWINSKVGGAGDRQDRKFVVGGSQRLEAPPRKRARWLTSAASDATKRGAGRQRFGVWRLVGGRVMVKVQLG